MSYGGSVGDMKYIFLGVWAQIDPVGFKNYWEQTTTSVAGESNKNLLVNDGAIKAVDSVAKLLNAKRTNKAITIRRTHFAVPRAIPILRRNRNF